MSGPAFAQANGIAGSGSGTFFSDGVGTWWAYGFVADLNTGYRVIRAQVVGFDGNGVLELGRAALNLAQVGPGSRKCAALPLLRLEFNLPAVSVHQLLRDP